MNIYILTFIVTALCDVVLRYLSLNNLLDYDFVRYLKPYFEQHTLLAAALIAGFVGVTAQVAILQVMDFPSSNPALFMLITFIISALWGFLMKATKLFPHLDSTYYKGLGPLRGALHDGVSGLIVQFIMFIIVNGKFPRLKGN
jgi:hypothetical protein